MRGVGVIGQDVRDDCRIRFAPDRAHEAPSRKPAIKRVRNKAPLRGVGKIAALPWPSREIQALVEGDDAYFEAEPIPGGGLGIEVPGCAASLEMSLENGARSAVAFLHLANPCALM